VPQAFEEASICVCFEDVSALLRNLLQKLLAPSLERGAGCRASAPRGILYQPLRLGMRGDATDLAPLAGDFECMTPSSAQAKQRTFAVGGNAAAIVPSESFSRS